MDSRLRTRLLFPQDFEKEYDVRRQKALENNKAAEELEAAARVAAQIAAQHEAVAKERDRIEAANRLLQQAAVMEAKAKACTKRALVAEATPKAKAKGRPKAAALIPSGLPDLPDCLNPEKIPDVFIPATPDGKEKKGKKEDKQDKKDKTSKKDNAKEKKEKEDKKDKKEKKAKKVKAAQEECQPSASGVFL